MKRFVLTLTIVLVLIPLVWAQAAPPLAQPAPPTQGDQDGELERIRQALADAVAAQAGDNLAFLVNRIIAFEIEISAQRPFAVLYLAMLDPETGSARTSEPGLAFAEKDVFDQWLVTLPADPAWLALLEAAPADLLSPEHKETWREINRPDPALVPAAALTGYKLPWEHGVTRYLSQSTEHDRYDASGKAHYAFDFYDPDLSEKMWDLYAAKAGVVWKMKEDVETCYEYTCSSFQPLGNYIILQDTTTSPVSYQLYLHLKQNSIPDQLQVGDTIPQGAFIGVVDNTGQSWGSHLHFMVHTTSTSYWGQSVDITFSDVPVNGGRPHRHDGVYYFDFDYCYPEDVCVTSQSAYVSDNDTFKDPEPPIGGITAPAEYAHITQGSVTLSGWADDPTSGLGSAQFIVNYDGSWREIGPAFTTSPFSYTWNLCDAGIPDGPLSVAVRVYDGVGSLTGYAGIRQVSKEYRCGASVPQPASDEVLICAETGYRGCAVFSTGSYPSSTSFPGGLADNDAASIRVGSAVQVTLYTEGGYAGRGETFLASTGDPNLADNLAGNNSISSVQVALSTQPPLAPAPVIPPAEPALVVSDVVSLHWDNAAWAAEYQVQLTLPSGSTKTYPWQTEPTLHLEGLGEGSHAWKVRARNAAGTSAYSSSVEFSLGPGDPIAPEPIVPPYLDPMDSSTDQNWTADGDWRLRTSGFWEFSLPSGGYAGFGRLTSPPVHIPSPGYYLRFDSTYKTETRNPHWDQRWVQISAGGGPFLDVRQVYDDLPNRWGQSYVIDLSPYAGQDIRIRFFFHTLDDRNNFTSYSGWGVDNVSVNNTPPVECDLPDAGDTPLTAQSISYGAVSTGEVCPNGDQDYFQFSAAAGDQISVDIDAQVGGSALDGVLDLYDDDGTSVWAASDDELAYEWLDPLLGYTIQQAGQYYLRLTDWTHPDNGGPAYFYTMTLLTDAASPVVQLENIAAGEFLPVSTTAITAAAADSGGSSLRRVDFYLHSPDFIHDDWVLLTSDMDGSDGWAAAFDPAAYAGGQGYALAAYAYDGAANVDVDIAWNLGIDTTAPASSIALLDPVQASTAFKIVVNGYDALAGIAGYRVQSNRDGGGWLDLDTGGLTYAWIVAEIGSEYAFRSSATDRAGNVEPLPAVADTSTMIPETVCSIPDGYEADDDYTQAAPLTPGRMQTHNFCRTSGDSPLGDADWLALDTIPGTHYSVRFFPRGEAAAGRLELFFDPAQPAVMEASSADFGGYTHLDFTAPASRVYIRVSHTDPAVAGNGVVYQIGVIAGYQSLLPVINR